MTIVDIDAAIEDIQDQAPANTSWEVTTEQKEKKRAVLAEARAAAAKKAHKKKTSKSKLRSRPALERSDSFESIRSCCTLTPIEETEIEIENTEADSSLQKTETEFPRNEIVFNPPAQTLTLDKGDIESGLDPTDNSEDSSESSFHSDLTPSSGSDHFSDEKPAPVGNPKCGLSWSKRRCMILSGLLTAVVFAIILAATVPGLSGSSASTEGATPDSINKGSEQPLNTPVFDKNGVMKSIYLNAGAHPAAVYKGFQGIEWISDNDYLSGIGQVYNSCPDNISTGTRDATLFCTERWFRGSVGRYDIQVAPERATYQVIMHFSETSYTSAKKRQFDIYIENKLVRSGFDIYAEARGNGTAVVLLAEAVVSDSALSIRLVPIPGFGNPKVNAIEVHDISNARKANDYENVAAETVNEQVPSTAIDEETLDEEDTVDDRPDEATNSRLTVFKVPFFVNAGGDSFTDDRGISWVSDSQIMANIGGSSSTYEQCRSGGNDEKLDETNPRALLYCSERWFEGKAGGFYELPLKQNNVELQVTLHFAELYYTKVGQRVFDVKVEGQMLRREYDILSETGGDPMVATTLTKNVWVTDGSLSINLIPRLGNVKISAIEVRAV